MDRITRDVSTFRMNSVDDYDDASAKSDSDDDTSIDAIYKRSRMRTREPSPPATPVMRSPSPMSDMDEVEDRRPETGPTPEQIAVYQRRLAVIHALVQRANAVYREQMARKKHLPALVRVKEEEIE